MIRLTRIHWHTKKVVEEPLYVNPSHVQWFDRGVYSYQTYDGSKLSDKTEGECTDIALLGYSFKVMETPEQIEAMINAWRKR